MHGVYPRNDWLIDMFWLKVKIKTLLSYLSVCHSGGSILYLIFSEPLISNKYFHTANPLIGLHVWLQAGCKKWSDHPLHRRKLSVLNHTFSYVKFSSVEFPSHFCQWRLIWRCKSSSLFDSTNDLQTSSKGGVYVVHFGTTTRYQVWMIGNAGI